MKSLDKLGKVISEDLRDSALNHYLDIESGWGGTEAVKEMTKKLSDFTDEERRFIRKLLTKCIDVGIHDFLFALEESRGNISVYAEGNDISGLSDGLQGEIFTEEGWFEKFSQHQEKGI